ncbi:MAG: UDP-N-acetylmuramoyl-L-alanine--D-glutamate ligase, partial [Hyphomicrobiaceae bacterium]|nr:UDP-N-acetylmuramoyl-L-alanine--D-glutamate ligase [Hyphomicrobiaceae bacterium]
TNAEAAEKALLSFPSHIYWILGGKPKAGGIGALAPHFPRIAKAYLIGEASEQFAATLDGKVDFEVCGTLEKAVAAAARDAGTAARGSAASTTTSQAIEHVVLLSPACASYDQFKNFEMRGDTFRQLVALLPGVNMRERSL